MVIQPLSTAPLQNNQSYYQPRTICHLLQPSNNSPLGPPRLTSGVLQPGVTAIYIYIYIYIQNNFRLCWFFSSFFYGVPTGPFPLDRGPRVFKWQISIYCRLVLIYLTIFPLPNHEVWVYNYQNNYTRAKNNYVYIYIYYLGHLTKQVNINSQCLMFF